MRHAKMQADFKGEYLGIREMRKHTAWYMAGYPNSAKLRKLVNQVETVMNPLNYWIYIWKISFGLLTPQ